ncbi:MAG: hypothetical protein JOZ31_16545 [Verrucomicrobia bacterium]|nr:hypothetical protein [Verrucomicrobiota bacterium]
MFAGRIAPAQRVEGAREALRFRPRPRFLLRGLCGVDIADRSQQGIPSLRDNELVRDLSTFSAPHQKANIEDEDDDEYKDEFYW